MSVLRSTFSSLLMHADVAFRNFLKTKRSRACLVLMTDVSISIRAGLVASHIMLHSMVYVLPVT